MSDLQELCSSIAIRPLCRETGTAFAGQASRRPVLRERLDHLVQLALIGYPRCLTQIQVGPFKIRQLLLTRAALQEQFKSQKKKNFSISTGVNASGSVSFLPGTFTP